MENEDVLKFLDEEIVTDLHKKGREYIDRFSNIKMKYKKFAITWSTAYLLGLFYICVYDQPLIHVNKYNLMSFATIFAIVGINLIQFLDVNIGHEHLRSLFKYLLFYEKKESCLIRPYSKIEFLLYKKNFDPILMDFSFYLSINFGIAILGVLALLVKMQAAFTSSLIVSISVISVFLIWQIVTVIYLLKKRHQKIASPKADR